MIIIVKNIVLFLLLIIFTFFNYSSIALGSEVQWEIVYNENKNIIKETVTVNNDSNIAVDTKQWNLSSSAENIIISREIEDWQVYDTLADKFPIAAEVKDYVLFESILLKGIDNEQQNLYSQIISEDVIEFSITLPGINNTSSAEQVDDYTYIWNISKTDDLKQKLSLKANTLKGFFLGLFIFTVGFLVIGTVFIIRMRKVHKLIEEEYSIEKAREELIRAKELADQTGETDEGEKTEI
jgi:hypothetical protein